MFLSNLSVVSEVIWVNLMLSADNVVVIAAVAHGLPPTQKRAALVGGALLATVLQTALTALVATAFTVKGLELLGGLILVPIAAKLVLDEPESPKPAEAGPAKTLARAMLLILLADLLMSVDNILAVAAVAGSNFSLLAIGLVVSIAVIMVCGGLIASLIDRWKWLSTAGAAFLAVTASRMILGDALIAPRLPARTWVAWAAAGVLVVVVLSVPAWWPRFRGALATTTARRRQP